VLTLAGPRIRPAQVADGLAEVQVRWPNVPIVFCETRQLAEEWTYRFLAAAHIWAETEAAAIERIGAAIAAPTDNADAPMAPEPSTAEVRAWARGLNIVVPDRGNSAPKSGRLGEPPPPPSAHLDRGPAHRPGACASLGAQTGRDR
jgi:hypothetical protein